MKSLFFHAAAAHPGVATALMTRAEQALRPFRHYLEQAIRSARERQARHALRWERVPVRHRLRLQPLDTRIAVRRPAPGWLLAGWQVPPPSGTAQSLMVVNRNQMIPVLEHAPTPAGLRIRPAAPLHADDQVFWHGRTCQLVPEPAPAPPTELRDRHGAAYPVRLVDEQGDDWIVIYDGPPSELAPLVDDSQPELEVRPQFDGLSRVVDARDRPIACRGEHLEVDELPASGLLRGNDGVRYQWTELSSSSTRSAGKSPGSSRKGVWIQLLPPEDTDPEALVDARAAFCEDGVDELWTERRRPRNPDGVIPVRRIDREQYRLMVDRLPPADALLHLPLDVRNLELQQRALRQLGDAPLPHHQGLLRLCEDARQVRWPHVLPIEPAEWFVLTNADRDGTKEQRDFVARALGSKDVTLLEGPPGSGKTTAICELVLQLRARGQRVLLCASTHVAVDNVLERLLERDDPVDAVRIGHPGRVDDKVQAAQIDQRVQSLVASWRGLRAFATHGDGELQGMAERAIVMTAELTCGTTMGIVRHPLFRDRAGEDRSRPWEQPIATYPHWDVLIVDEASKTTVQELLVPALMARRWVIIGDVRQLPPFAERADLVANLRSLTDAQRRPLVPDAHQRACLLVRYLRRHELHGLHDGAIRRLLAEPADVLYWLEAELVGRDLHHGVVRVAARPLGRAADDDRRVRRVTVDELQCGDLQALHVAAADWVLVADADLAAVSPLLPPELVAARLPVTLAEDAAWRFRHAGWLARARPWPRTVRASDRRRGEIGHPADLEADEAPWLAQAQHDWASEVAWRITRVQELRRSRRRRERERYLADIEELLPWTGVRDAVRDAIDEIRDIGLPGVMEVLQDGLGDALGQGRSARASALTHGMGEARRDRLISLRFQHRMHPEISAFPRDLFYQHQALVDANTVAERDRALGWSFAPELPARRVWIHVRGQESAGVNRAEIDRMRAVLQAFLVWARTCAPSGRRPAHWEVACLCFYVKQEQAIRDMLRELTGQDRQTRFEAPNVEIVCGTVDRFQGREADMVLLSLRNTRRAGFLDSVNRLNVALTRARQQLVILGDVDYFQRCAIDELSELALRSKPPGSRGWPLSGPERSTR